MSNDERRVTGALSVDPVFHDFVESELLPAIGFDSATFWGGIEAIVNDLTPVNRELLRIRDDLQTKIDQWHQARAGSDWQHAEYVEFLTDIGYLKSMDGFPQIETENVDAEIAEIAGPQLVVPVSNARFAINAANARWGSLYDALYGSDVIGAEDGLAQGTEYNPARGAAVIRYATEFLDRTLPLEGISHSDVNAYGLDHTDNGTRFVASQASGDTHDLQKPGQFVGFSEQQKHFGYLFRNHGLYVEIQVDPEHIIGRDATANIADVILEAAVTTIQDCEDSVTAVDAADKVGVYRNWLGLMQGDLKATFTKGGKKSSRILATDRVYTAADGGELVLSGRSLLLVRNVGHLMTTDAVFDREGQEVFEGMLDAIITTACAMTDRLREGYQPNSRAGSIYIVKPKMHGPNEVAFTDTLFGRVEQMFELQSDTIKVGIMDEERRTTVNLPACIGAAKNRIVFINTGFLDRTGDEIHTSMHAGPVVLKGTMRQQPWIAAYEDWNVDVGIRCGLPGKAQIGKGMWPKPDKMKQMMDTKQSHPEAGANCSWVPSPTAATLHAMHYHAVDVRRVQTQLARRKQASLEAILKPPLAGTVQFSAEEIQKELNNNAQGILGYVVRWIDHGVGCSKVPDIDDVGLMEDRATLRISSQHIANWLMHKITTKQQVLETFKRMAEVVDKQNEGDASYKRMSENFDNSIAFKAACALVFEGTDQPNGYTEPLLHKYRRQKKAQLAR